MADPVHLLIEGTVITMDPQRRVIRDGAVAVHDDEVQNLEVEPHSVRAGQADGVLERQPLAAVRAGEVTHDIRA